MTSNPVVKVIAGLVALVALAVPSVRVLLPGILEHDPPTPEARVRIAVHTPDEARDLSVNVSKFISRTGRVGGAERRRLDRAGWLVTGRP